MELTAKPIIKDKYWIVTNGQKKVGNIQANNAGFGVQLNGNDFQFDSTSDVQKQTRIRFFEPLKSNKSKANIPYPQYPTPEKQIYNSVFDVQKHLHLFTKTRRSKCWYAAGWFVINQNEIKTTVFCPKYIFIQRYNYTGPFKTEDEAILEKEKSS